MTKVIYEGDISPCKVRVLGTVLDKWTTGEVKEICPRIAAKLTSDNKNFKIVGATKYDKSGISEKPFEGKSDKVSDVKTEVLKAPIKKLTDEKLNSMDKDALLDYTAREHIKADYTMTVEQLKKVIKEHQSK